MDMKGRVGKHLKKQPANRTVQSKISTEPPLPCKKECGRTAAPSRKDGLCENCAVFQDRSRRH
jgi:hypothetical protein